MEKEYGDAAPRSNPPTVCLDSSSAPHKKVESTLQKSAESKEKERDSKLNYFDHFEQQRSFKYNHSFVVYISLAQIAVFVYHVILLANKGITVDIYGPFYTEVNQKATFARH